MSVLTGNNYSTDCDCRWLIPQPGLLQRLFLSKCVVVCQTSTLVLYEANLLLVTGNFNTLIPAERLKSLI